jgi:hypothetical protein
VVSVYRVRCRRDLLATVVAGVLYTVASPSVAFAYAATWMIGAVLASGLLRPAQDLESAEQCVNSEELAMNIRRMQLDVDKAIARPDLPDQIC